MRYVRALLCGFLLAVLMTGCEQQPAPPEADTSSAADTVSLEEAEVSAGDCTLTMGYDPWKPYQYRTAEGEVAGLDVELATAAARLADCDIDFVEGQWMGLLGQLQAGELSLLAGATRTPGREAFAVFTAPYRAESFVVYTLAANEALQSANTLEELQKANVRLGTVAEYYYGPEVTVVLDALHEAGRLHEAVVSELNYDRLANGEIDAFVEDPYVAGAMLSDREAVEEVVPTGIRVQAADVAFMLSREGVSPEHASRFASAVETLTANGVFEEIKSRYRY